MKIAIVRGPSLNKFEMQYYEPLARRHEIVCFGSTKPIYDRTTINLPIKKLPCLGQALGFIPGAIKALYWVLGDPQGLLGLEDNLYGFDIAHTAETSSFYTHQALLAKIKGKVKKVVATVSENIPFNQEWYPKQKALKAFALANLDHVLAISNLSKEALTVEGYPEEKITVVPHGLDLKKFKPGKRDEKLARELGLKKDDFVILSIGRLVWGKGFYDLLLAVNYLVKDEELTDKNLKFLIIGSGPEKKNLVSLRDKLGLKKVVVFAQNLAYNQMVKLYNLADVFVLASIPTLTWQEQFGMVLIEAMACGVPVISTRSGGVPEVVDEAGILVPPNNWHELAQSLKKLILDQKLRQDLSKKGQEKAKKQFDRFLIAQKIEEIYKKMMEER